MFLKLPLFTLLLSFGALAQTNMAPDKDSPAGKTFCEERLSDDRALQRLITSSGNQIGFNNKGGLFGGGTCWWHSRFTRAAMYLAVFDPSLPKPDLKEAKKLITRIRNRAGMTLIPGYRNLRELSYDFPGEVQDKLNDWQKADGAFKAAWVRGISGAPQVTPEKLSEKMDELYEQVNRGEIVYQMLQMPGITAHAWLVTGMKKLADGYELKVIDSNTGNDTYFYRSGMTTFNYMGWYRFVPYTGQETEERKLREKLTDFCKEKSPETPEVPKTDDQNESPDEVVEDSLS